MPNIWLSVRPVVFAMGLQWNYDCLGNSFTWISLIHRHSHKYSPTHGMFSPSSVTLEILICLFRTWSFTRFTNDLNSTDNSKSVSSFTMTNCWGLSSSWELILSSRFHHDGFPRERNQVEFLVSLSKKVHRVSISLVHLNISFPLLRRPSRVIITLGEACWGETFHKLLMIIVSEALFRSMPISGRSDRSSFLAVVLQRFWFPWLLFSGLTEVEDDTCDGILALRLIIGRDFAVTRSSPESCSSLFAIASEQIFGLKWLIEKAQQMIPFITCEISFGQKVTELVYWCHFSWFGFGPFLLICRTFSSPWDLMYSKWHSDCLGNSFPWLSLIPSLQP